MINLTLKFIMVMVIVLHACRKRNETRTKSFQKTVGFREETGIQKVQKKDGQTVVFMRDTCTLNIIIPKLINAMNYAILI